MKMILTFALLCSTSLAMAATVQSEVFAQGLTSLQGRGPQSVMTEVKPWLEADSDVALVEYTEVLKTDTEYQQLAMLGE